MPFLLGIDGGGTKTAVLLGSLRGKPGAEIRVGGTSLTRRPEVEVAAELRAAVAQVTAVAGTDCRVCRAGFASGGNAGNRKVYERLLAELLPGARIVVSNDVEIALQGATGGADGIVVIAGTGSAACGSHQGRSAQAGGLGPESGDEGSAHWIGRAAATAGLLPSGGAWHTAPFAALLPEVLRRAAAGDAAALKIFNDAGHHLARLAVEVATALAWSDPPIWAVGGVFRHCPPVWNACGDQLRALLPAVRFAHAPRSPVAGALQLARALLPPPS